jgi:hypothetical protein
MRAGGGWNFDLPFSGDKAYYRGEIIGFRSPGDQTQCLNPNTSKKI